MKKCSTLIFCVASLLVTVPSLCAQALYTADQKTRIQVGAGVSVLNTDYTQKDVTGLSAWGDYDFSKHIGVEVSTHFGEFITPGDLTENTYLVGPRFTYRRRKVTLYGKALVGRGTVTLQDFNQSSSYNLYAFGGGLEYKILHKVNIRLIDYEQQKWPDFPPNGLSPTIISFGASYIIH